MTVQQIVYPPTPVEAMTRWMETHGYSIQEQTRGASYAKGYWVARHPRESQWVLVRYRGTGTREDVEKALKPVAEKLDALGLGTGWEFPDGHYAALAVQGNVALFT